MRRFLAGRLPYLVAVLIGVSFLSFFLANIAPVDPAEAYVRRITKAPTAEMVERYREEFGFNDPLPLQYVNWLKDVVRLDFGNSYATGKPAMGELMARMPLTLGIAGLACLLILVLAPPLGILAAHREGGWLDRLVMGMSILFISIPGYFLGLLFLLVFGIGLKIMPIVGHGHPASILCAALVLALPMIGSLSRVLRTLLLENRSSPYVTYARARGIPRRQVMLNHLLRNAAPPCITLFGQNMGYLLAVTTIVENIFSAPGIGQYVLDAALNRDFPVINAYIVLMALVFVVCNVAAEALGLLLNPTLGRRAGA